MAALSLAVTILAFLERMVSVSYRFNRRYSVSVIAARGVVSQRAGTKTNRLVVEVALDLDLQLLQQLLGQGVGHLETAVALKLLGLPFANVPRGDLAPTDQLERCPRQNLITKKSEGRSASLETLGCSQIVVVVAVPSASGGRCF